MSLASARLAQRLTLADHDAFDGPSGGDSQLTVLWGEHEAANNRDSDGREFDMGMTATNRLKGDSAGIQRSDYTS